MIRYRAGALRDIVEAARWYRRERPAYETKFFERLHETLRRVEQAPRSFPVAMEAEGVRKARMLRTAYAIAFVVLAEHEVEIVALVHGAKRPGWWTHRLRKPR
jgi:plasmid stabilization system protein ParE